MGRVHRGVLLHLVVMLACNSATSDCEDLRSEHLKFDGSEETMAGVIESRDDGELDFRIRELSKSIILGVCD